MANLGTLWFGADIDLTQLQQKINQGNQSILNALKMDYDPQSYSEMVSKLRTAISNEKFEINISANTQKAVQDLQNAAKGGLGNGGSSFLSALDQQILDQTRKVNDLIAKVEYLKTVWKTNGGSANDYLAAVAEKTKEEAILKTLIAQRKEYNRATKESTKEKQEAKKATDELNRSHVKLTTTLARGVTITSRFGEAMSGLFAIGTARQFLNNVIEIGGQLEKQRISMGAIVGDVSRANDLFENIKSLAVKSPFGVVELDQYSKQLAAYGIEQSDLFGMTKRLADISAGAGQDIGRLALALGHVKSATYLTGMTLRQFSMNNIPMLKMLADYYSEVEQRAVSTAEVQKRISQRQVSYDDVIEQIKRMTDEGGQFFNMQEKISESLQAKFKNLKDSFDIMYGEIAESKIGDWLKKFADGATAMSREWSKIANIMGGAGAYFGAARLATMALNQGIATHTASVGILSQKIVKLNAETITQLYTEKKLTKEHILNAVATGRLTVATAQAALGVTRITKAQLEEIATTGKVNQALIYNAMATSRYSVEQLRAIARIKAHTTALNLFGGRLKWLNNLVLNFRIGWLGVSSAFSAMASGFMRLVPQIAAFAGIGIAIDAINESSRRAEEQQKRLADMTERANEGFRNMSEIRQKFKVGDSASMNDEELTNNITEMVEHLKNYSLTAKDTFNNAFEIDKEGKSVHSLKEQYEILAEAIDNTAKSYQALNKDKYAVEHASETSDVKHSGLALIGQKIGGYIESAMGFFGSKPTDLKLAEANLQETVNIYSECLANATKAEQEFMKNRLDIVGALQDMGISDAANMDGDQIFELLTEWMTLYPQKYEEFQDRLGKDAKKSFDEVKERWDNVGMAFGVTSSRMEKAAKDLFAHFSSEFKSSDITTWPSEWRERVSLAVDGMVKDISGFTNMTIEQQNELRNILLQPFGITVDTKEAQQQVNDFLAEMESIVGREWIVRIGIKSTSAVESLDSAQRGYEKAVANINQLSEMQQRLKNEGQENSARSKEIQRELENTIAERDKNLQAITALGGTIPTNKPKGGGGRTGGTKTDEQLKLWRDRKKELEEFWHVYETLLKRMSDEDAIKEINKRGLFPSLFDDKGGLKVDISKGLSNALDTLLKETSGNTPERRQLQREIIKAIFDIDEKDIQGIADKALKEMNDYISSQSEKFNLFKSLFEKTGNKEFAKSAFSDGRIWDDAAREFEKKLMEVSGETSIDFFMSDEKAQEHFKKIDGGYELWKKIVELTSKNYTDALGKAADATSDMMSIEDKIAKKEAEIEDLRNKNDRVDHTKEIEKAEQEIVKLKGELLSISPEFKALFRETTDLSIRQIKKLYDETKAWKDMIDQNRTGAVYNQNQELVGYNYTNRQGKPDYIPIEEYKKLEKQLGKLQKKVPELTISFKRLWAWITGEDADNDGKADMTFKDIAQDLAKIMDAAKEATSALSDMFDALGHEDMADGFAFAGEVLGAGSDIAKGIATSNPLDVINGIAKGISAIAGYHDKKLDKAIHKSELRVKQLQNAYKNLEWEIAHQLTAITKEQSAAMLSNLEKQEKELETQLANEQKKKKKDGGKIIDLQQEIEEAKQQLKTFYEDIAKDRYGVDIDSWAGDFASALVDAFASGEDAAEAFDKKVADIMKNVVSNIIKIGVIKPAMEQLQDYLFGNKGIATTNSEGGVEITANEAIGLMEQLVALKKEVDKGKNIYDIVAQAMKSMGIDMNGESSNSSSMSNTIKGITEQTADLLASYINAIRADVSVIRAQEIDLPSINLAVQQISVLTATQLQVQSQIAGNTLRNAEAAEAIWNMLSNATRDKAFGLYVK